MAHTYTTLVTHVIFSTESRIRCIDPGLRTELYPYVRAIVRALKCDTIEIGGWEDHLHIAARIHPSVAVADLINKIKSNSSKWVHEKWPGRIFGWQTGYGAFSVNPRDIASLVRYIRDQEEHHRVKTFAEEYREFLESSGVAIDERYFLD